MTYNMDDKDTLILSVLRENACLTTRQISKKTLLPPTTVNNRIRRLKEEGVIQKFTVIPDYTQIGKGVLVYVLVSASLLQLKELKRTQYDIVKDLKKFDFIERADIVTGGTDIVAMVRVADVSSYDKVLLEKIQMIAGVQSTQSLIVVH